ncbi:MAG: HAMP domain-containing histidine kinase [Bacteroidaceae bacterium]|nr:HAMP domain-containing histidine kinase [Bacteroidaceae bacterium]
MGRKNIDQSRLVYLILVLIFCSTVSPCLSAGIQGLPFFKNFNTEDYHAHNRNTDVVCDDYGQTFFANFEGVLIFNGVTWTILRSPGFSRITCLYRDNVGTIWFGGYNVAGKIVVNHFGDFKLHCLISDNNQKLEKDVLHSVVKKSSSHDSDESIGEILSITKDMGNICFHTLHSDIYVEKGEKLHYVKVNNENLQNRIFSNVLKNTDIVNQVLLLGNGEKVVATANRGLVFVDADDQELSFLSEKNGLCSNCVNAIAVNKKGCIWGATNAGVFQVRKPSFYSRYTSNEGLKGEVLSMIRYQKKLYVGTYQGIFLFNVNAQQFMQLPHISQACWMFKVGPSGRLYAATNDGLYLINGTKSDMLIDNTVFSVAFSLHNKDIYVGMLDGVYSFKADNPKKMTQFANIDKVTNIIVDKQGTIWMQTIFGEIYKKVSSSDIFHLVGKKDGFASNSGNQIRQIGQQIFLITMKNNYIWNEKTKTFQSYMIKRQEDGSDIWPSVIVPEIGEKGFWVTDEMGHHVQLVKRGKPKTATNEALHALAEQNIRIVYQETRNLVWFGGDFGLYQIDLHALDEIWINKPKIYIRYISVDNDSIHYGGNRLNKESMEAKRFKSVVSFKPGVKEITFQYSADTYQSNAAIYHIHLEGYQDDWKSTTEMTQVYYNLRPGHYCFQVYVSDVYNHKSSIKEFSFDILTPYYLRWYSILCYIIFLGLLVVVFIGRRTYKLRKKNELLEKVVKDRTELLRLQNQQIVQQSKKLENTLADLHNAQDSLVHNEKLAAVGVLTKGLIDRIQNPLNYVNNFAHLTLALINDLKNDLVEEKEHMGENNYNDSQDILDMMIENLSKIEIHGSSTSRILKSMEEVIKDNKSGNLLKMDITQLLNKDVEVVGKYYEKEIAAYHIEIDSQLPNYPITILGNAEQLSKTMMSVINNSMYAIIKKYKKTQYNPMLIVKVVKDEKNVVIKIRDNGIGIETNILKHLYDPFFTTKTTAEASGIGLYLSKEIILNHHGTIDIQSEQGVYAETTIVLPLFISESKNN